MSVVPQNPSRRLPNPVNQEHLRQASRRLFQRWIEQHPEDQAAEALVDLPLPLTKKRLPFHAPHFVERVLQDSPPSAAVTTLNLQLQAAIEKITRQYLQQQKGYGIDNAAVMLIDVRSMEVKALMGSGDYFNTAIHGQVNGTKAKRSPGSALKPFIYALALDQGLIHPYTVLKDTPSSFADYNPENFDRDFLGPLKAKEALILSRNIPAIDLAGQLKEPTLYQFLQQAHLKLLTAEQACGLSLVLGGAEVTMEELIGLYAMLANQGLWKPLRWRVDQPPTEGERLLSPEASFLTLDMLRDTPRPGPVYAAMDKQLPVYWKTGTSSCYRDAWAVGLFGPYVLAVWVGDFSGRGNPAFVGATAAAPLFFNVIEALDKTGPLIDLLVPPANLTKVKVCEASGLLPNPHCPHLVETWFIPGKSPIQTDTVHRLVDGQAYEFWPSDLLKIFKQAGLQRRSPPTAASSQGQPPRIISPQRGITYTVRLNRSDNPILFSATADADVETLYWFVDQQFVGSCGRDESLTWQAKAGTHSVYLVDDHGRSAVILVGCSLI